MMIKQRKHTIRIQKPDSTSLIKANESPIRNDKIRLEDIRPEETPTLCAQSTPKRHDSQNSSKSQDGSDSPDYRASLPLTQDENIEVTWDWHSAARNDSSKKPNDITTPKRAAIIRRKRPPSSPLVYKPIRKQLIKRENTEGIEQFKAEMIALTKRINRGESCSEFNDQIGDIANTPMETKSEDMNDEADTYDIINNKYASLKTDHQADNKSVDDLFNDSMDEVIIQFSQETEKKLSISPSGNVNHDNGDSLIKKNPSASSSYLIKPKNNGSTIGINIGKLNQNCHNVNTRPVSQPQKLVNRNQFATSSRVSRVPEKQIAVKADSTDLFIPDDSFDDFLVGCDTSEPTNVSKTNKCLSTAKPATVQTHNNVVVSSAMKSNESSWQSLLTSRPPSSLSRNNSNGMNSFIKNSTKAQMQLGSLAAKASQVGGQKMPNVQSAATPTRTWKFFKSKSHSDSNFDCSETPAGTNVKRGISGSHDTSRTNSSSSLKSGASWNSGAKGSRVYGGKAVSNGDQIVQRAWTTSGLDSNVRASFSNQKDNVNMYNVNRCREEKKSGEHEFGSQELQHQPGSLTSSMQSMQITRTPEEIERNRIEAMQKLEARKKRLQAASATISSSSTIRSSSMLNTQRIPVER